MAAIKTITIDSILGGISPMQNFGATGQYQNGLGIDPDMPIADSGIYRPSGYIRPTGMSTFSSSAMTSPALWIETNPKNELIYSYLTNGRFLSYSSALGSETNIGTPTSGAGNGLRYYNNYIWGATPTDLFRYGPLSGSPSIINTSWTGSSYTGTSGGLGKSALSNTSYPSIRGISLPNHVLHRHTDGKLYVADVVGNQGYLHYVYTSKTSVEGDTDAGSSYGALDFLPGYYPVCIESYATDLVVALIEGTGTTTKQRNAAVSFWDTTSTSYQLIIQQEFPDPLITAMKNVNGTLYVFSGNASGGCRISAYSGGYSFREVAYIEDMLPPLQGAVDAEMNRIIFGGFTTDPEASASVYALGSKDIRLGNGLQNILNTKSTGANPLVTALKYAQHSSYALKAPIVAWKDDTTQGMDKMSTTYGISLFRSNLYRVGRPFTIKRIIIPLSQAVAANMTITPTLYIDDASTSVAQKTINSTNFANSERNVILYPELSGYHNFFLQLRWTGTALLGVSLPITIEFEINEP